MELNDNYGLYEVNDIINLPYNEQEKYADEFSEGNVELKGLLLDCWHNGIGTIACCSGHNEPDKQYNSYIYFQFNEKSLNFVSSILDSVKHGELKIKNLIFDNIVQDGFAVYTDYSEANDFFKRLRNLVKLRNIMCDFERDTIKSINDLVDNSSDKFVFNLSLSRTTTDEESLWLLCVNELDPVGKREDINSLLDCITNNRKIEGARYEVSDSSIKQLNSVIEGRNLTNSKQSVTI